MKKFFLISLLMVAGVALAGGIVSSQYTLDSTNAAPTTSTVGIPVTVNGEPIKRISVTVEDYSDGGSADYEYIASGTAKAWLRRPSLCFPDGGACWAQVPDLDLTLASGTGHGVSIAVVATKALNYPFATGDRLYYSTASVLGVDGGSPRHNVLIQAGY